MEKVKNVWFHLLIAMCSLVLYDSKLTIFEDVSLENRFHHFMDQTAHLQSDRRIKLLIKILLLAALFASVKN